MFTLVIEHFKVSELPQQWAQRMQARPEQTVTVHIETESAPTTRTPDTFVTDDPASVCGATGKCCRSGFNPTCRAEARPTFY